MSGKRAALVSAGLVVLGTACSPLPAGIGGHGDGARTVCGPFVTTVAAMADFSVSPSGRLLIDATPIGCDPQHGSRWDLDISVGARGKALDDDLQRWIGDQCAQVGGQVFVAVDGSNVVAQAECLDIDK